MESQNFKFTAWQERADRLAELKVCQEKVEKNMLRVPKKYNGLEEHNRAFDNVQENLLFDPRSVVLYSTRKQGQETKKNLFCQQSSKRLDQSYHQQQR
jgi:hypothetical protein